MSSNARTTGLALAIVLLIAPLAGLASASYHASQDDSQDHAGDRAPAKAWQDLKAALTPADASEAWQVYRGHLAPHAAAAPEAAKAIEGGLSLVENASSPEDPDAIVGSQQADKATYALAYANLQAAAEADDLETAQAWFDLLATKFDGEDDLVESKAAFEGATTETLDDAVATLDEEYQAIITAKVYKETVETPELLEAGEQAIAIKEAAEGRWYFLSIDAVVAERLGDERRDALRADLDELVSLAREGSDEAVSDKAEEVLAHVATFALTSAPQAKADAFAAYKEAIGQGDVDQAREIYADAFAETTEEYASDAHERIQAGLDALETALAQGDEAEVKVQAQIVKKGILESSYKVAIHELTEGETTEGLEHFAVLVSKFAWLEQENDGALAVGKIAASGSVDDDLLLQAKRGVAAKFLDKVREEVEEVFIHWDDPATAREKAMEGIAYQRPALDHVTDVLGQAPAEELLAELEELYEATTAGDRAAADAAAAEVVKLLDQVEAGGQEVTELDSLVSDLRGKISFVGEEYRGYFEAQEAGDEQEADTELGEAKAFARASRDRIDTNRALIDETDPGAADELLATLDEILALIEADAPLSEVETLVDDALVQLEALKQAGVPGTVTVRLGPGETSDGALVVPVHLEGLPTDGVAYQATLSYPSELLRAIDVSSELEVGAGTIDEAAGEVRFNGASTTTPTGAVARITFEVLDASASAASLDVTVTELTDGAGNALGVANVEGDQLSLPSGAGASADHADQAPTPTPGALVVLALISLAALAVRRRLP